MAKTVEIAIPDELHEALTAKATARGLSLAEYIDRELDGDISSILRNHRIFDEILGQPPVHLKLSSAEIIRELRGPLPEDDGDRR